MVKLDSMKIIVSNLDNFNQPHFELYTDFFGTLFHVRVVKRETQRKVVCWKRFHNFLLQFAQLFNCCTQPNHVRQCETKTQISIFSTLRYDKINFGFGSEKPKLLTVSRRQFRRDVQLTRNKHPLHHPFFFFSSNPPFFLFAQFYAKAPNKVLEFRLFLFVTKVNNPLFFFYRI